ncbi:MAG: penicillin-binding protein 2 [Microgenomates group bacterium Gr01-1014_80]|nr:MAG: penicillin-binding protein 2 [Microgenomates group bacterium Gr01-1014_80]
MRRKRSLEVESGEWKDTLLPNFDQEGNQQEVSPWKATTLLAVSLIIFFSLLLRLFHLQIVKGAENRNLADGNRIQIKVMHAPRGVIFDRNGKVLASNAPGFRLKAGEKVRYISRDEALRLEAKEDPDFKNLEVDSIRSYPLGEVSAHILGNVSGITPEELKELRGYRIGDRLGRGGVEEAYEKFLKGVDGGEVVEVDSSGEVLRTLRKTDPIAGQNLYLTIDVDLQKLTFNLLQETVKKTGSCCAATIVADPGNGEILSMVSLPSFDPEHLSDYLNADHSPILNRAVAGTYPPGSTFKIASALGGLSSGKINATTAYEDTGEMFLGPYKFSNWYFNQYGRTEGQVDLVKAIQRSNDIYFYRMSEVTGEKILGETARKLGLGKILSVDIPGEAAGLIPGPDWKTKFIGDVWFPGDTLHMSIGQGFVLTTPLQVLNLSLTVASGGNQLSPHLALKTTDSRENLIKEFEFPAKRLDFKREHIELVKKGMVEAASQGGTAWPLFAFPVQTAGKTGTAEYGDLKDKTHAWYTAFAPADDPKIAVVVLVEGGGEGSTVASPIAKEIFRWFLSEDKKNLIKDTDSVATESARQLGE